MSKGPKTNMEAKSDSAFAGAHKNFARFVNATHPYCFNTNLVSYTH